MDLAQAIVNKALALGYDGCGIIKAERMQGYAAKLKERIDRFPETERYLDQYYAFARHQRDLPWTRSIVVSSRWYGKYHIPEHLRGIIGKYYLTDRRREKQSQGYKDSISFEQYLNSLGIRTQTDRVVGITALRWAARQAGLGLIRKNNFFYTEQGSWFYLEAFLIDRELEYLAESNTKPCPEKCTLCIKACPTGSLAEPYMTNRSTCISCLNTREIKDFTAEPYSSKMGSWIYGCDLCQDACPINKNAWIEEEEFPFLTELSKHLSYEEIITADYDYLKNVVQPKLWYIPKDQTWRFKTNTLNAMLNCFKPAYLPLIHDACNDSNKHVRHMASWVLSKCNAGRSC